MKRSIPAFSATFAFLAFAAFCPSSARADTITTFQVTGALQDGISVSGTLAIDTTAGAMVSSAITVGNDSFSGFAAAFGSSGTTLTSAGGFPTMHLLLPVSTLEGYAGGTLGSFANPVSGIGDYSSIYFSDSMAMYLTSGSLTPVTTTPEIPTFAMIGAGLLLLTLGRRWKHGEALGAERIAR